MEPVYVFKQRRSLAITQWHIWKVCVCVCLHENRQVIVLQAKHQTSDPGYLLFSHGSNAHDTLYFTGWIIKHCFKCCGCLTWVTRATQGNTSLSKFCRRHSAVVFLYSKMLWFITQHTELSFDAVTQKHWDALFQQRLVRLYGDKQRCDKLQGKV